VVEYKPSQVISLHVHPAICGPHVAACPSVFMTAVVQKHTDKSREDIKQMRRSLGTAQKVYKDAHTISTHYVVVSMLWRNATRRRLVISAFEPEVSHSAVRAM